MRFVVRLIAAFSIALAADRPARVAAAASESTMNALEVMADLTLIDATCQGVIVNFGVGFRFAAAQGVRDVAMLPGGRRRAEFEAVLRTREASFGAGELCSQIVRNYSEALPGSLTPLYRHADSGRESSQGERAYEPLNR